MGNLSVSKRSRRAGCAPLSRRPLAASPCYLIRVAQPSLSGSARRPSRLERGGRRKRREMLRGMQIRQVWAHLTRLSQGQRWCIAHKSIKKGSARKVFLLV